MAKTKIMVVHHDDEAREATAAILRKSGYEVVTRGVAIGTSAAVLRERPAVVLLELTMPLLTGAEVARSVRATEGNQARVVLRSRCSEAELGRLADQCGADGYLSNEAGAAELLVCVKTHVLRSAPGSGALRKKAASGTRQKRVGYLLVACSEATRREIHGAVAVRLPVRFTDSGTEALRLLASHEAPSHFLLGTSLTDLPFHVVWTEARRFDAACSVRMLVLVEEGTATTRIAPDMPRWALPESIDSLFERLALGLDSSGEGSRREPSSTGLGDEEAALVKGTK